MSSTDSRLVVCLRDGACGPGGVRCYCCTRAAGGGRTRAGRRRTRVAFAKRVRVRLARFVAADLVRNPE